MPWLVLLANLRRAHTRTLIFHVLQAQESKGCRRAVFGHGAGRFETMLRRDSRMSTSIRTSANPRGLLTVETECRSGQLALPSSTEEHPFIQ